MAPTINIQAPTESNAAKTATRVPSGSNLSRVDPRTPRQVDVDIIEEKIIPDAAVPDPRERDLPAVPSESIHSNRPSPVPQSTSLHQATATRTPGTQRTVVPPTQDGSPRNLAGTASLQDSTRGAGVSVPIHNLAPTSAPSPRTTAAVTAPTHLDGANFAGGSGRLEGRDKVHVIDALNGSLDEAMPWDRVTQRLYSWAMVWEEESFSRALENISLGKQVSWLIIPRVASC
jgi:hypothetical protein